MKKYDITSMIDAYKEHNQNSSKSYFYHKIGELRNKISKEKYQKDLFESGKEVYDTKMIDGDLKGLQDYEKWLGDDFGDKKR